MQKPPRRFPIHSGPDSLTIYAGLHRASLLSVQVSFD